MAKRNDDRWGTDANVRWGTGRQRSGMHLRNTVSGRTATTQILDEVSRTVEPLKYLRCRKDVTRCLKLTPAFYDWVKTRLLIQGSNFEAFYTQGIVAYSANLKADDIRGSVDIGNHSISVKCIKMKPVMWKVTVLCVSVTDW
jgi:hypothetical protein